MISFGSQKSEKKNYEIKHFSISRQTTFRCPKNFSKEKDDTHTQNRKEKITKLSTKHFMTRILSHLTFELCPLWQCTSTCMHMLSANRIWFTFRHLMHSPHAIGPLKMNIRYEFVSGQWLFQYFSVSVSVFFLCIHEFFGNSCCLMWCSPTSTYSKTNWSNVGFFSILNISGLNWNRTETKCIFGQQQKFLYLYGGLFSMLKWIWCNFMFNNERHAFVFFLSIHP